MADGVELATAWVRLTFSAEGSQEAITKEIAGASKAADGAGDEAGKKYGKGFGAGAKAALTVGAGAAIAGVVSVFKTGMEELKFGEQISAQTDQLIKNTGAAFSTSWIEDYTLSLSQLSGISEEDLQSAGNNVLKFGDVSQDTYERAVASINDMGGAGKDVAGISEALGKALADPAKGAALLKRQGVLLNEEQQALIASFSEAGDKAGAQGVILDALEGTYGGMAEAAGGTLQGGLNKLNNTWENLAGTAVESLMPAISGIVEGLSGFFGWVEQNQWVLPVLAIAIGTLLVAAFVAWTASIWAANAAMLANPITWIILAIVALIAIIIFLVMNWDAVVAFLTDVWNGFVDWFVSVMDGFFAWWNGLWTAVWEWIVSIWQGIVDAVTNHLNLLMTGIQIIGQAISDWWNGLWQGIGDFIGSVWNWIVNFVTAYINAVFSIIQAVGQAISGWWNGLWNGIVSFFTGVWQNIFNVVRTVQGVFGDVFNAVAGIVRGAFEGVVGAVKSVINGIIGAVNGVIDGINSVAGAVGGALGINLQLGKIPMLATGGTITRSGTVLVGERGPELLNLPRGASVDPDITNVAAGGLREGDRLVLVVEGTPLSAVVKRELGGYDSGRRQQGARGYRGGA